MDAALTIVAVGAVVLAVASLAIVVRQRRDRGLDDEGATQLLSALRGDLADLQSKALQQNTEQFLALAESRLRAESARGEEQIKARKEEIDDRLKAVGDSLQSLKEFVETVDKTRGESILELSTVVKQSRSSIDALSAATADLNQALTAGQARGQWGERMADDILRVSGLLEGVNYRRNKRIEGGTTRPDFTFFLPQDHVVHMDVKFPLAGYMRYLAAETDADRQAATKQFLIDVRLRIREVTTRDYIDPSGGTIDYVLVFIPNEQVYGFIHENDPALLDDALTQKVILCSPFTLFAVLAVIRQAMENFRLERHANEILAALGAFHKQWESFKGAMDSVGTRLQQTQTAYDRLTGTRTQMLDRQVRRVEELRQQAGIEPARLEDEEPEAAELPAAPIERN